MFTVLCHVSRLYASEHVTVKTPYRHYQSLPCAIKAAKQQMLLGGIIGASVVETDGDGQDGIIWESINN